MATVPEKKIKEITMDLECQLTPGELLKYAAEVAAQIKNKEEAELSKASYLAEVTARTNSFIFLVIIASAPDRVTTCKSSIFNSSIRGQYFSVSAASCAVAGPVEV